MSKSKLLNYSDDEIVELLNKSKSLRKFLHIIGYNSNGGGIYKYVNGELKKENF